MKVDLDTMIINALRLWGGYFKKHGRGYWTETDEAVLNLIIKWKEGEEEEWSSLMAKVPRDDRGNALMPGKVVMTDDPNWKPYYLNSKGELSHDSEGYGNGGKRVSADRCTVPLPGESGVLPSATPGCRPAPGDHRTQPEGPGTEVQGEDGRGAGEVDTKLGTLYIEGEWKESPDY